MGLKIIGVSLAVLLLAATAFRFRHHEAVTQLTQPAAPAVVRKIEFDNGSAAADAAAAARSAAAAAASGAAGTTPPKPAPKSPVAGVQKCKRGHQIIYTDGDCPPGSQNLTLSQGSVTVVPAVKRDLSKEPPAAPRDESLQTLREKMMERAVQ